MARARVSAWWRPLRQHAQALEDFGDLERSADSEPRERRRRLAVDALVTEKNATAVRPVVPADDVE
jgi:hypothetical protein